VKFNRKDYQAHIRGANIPDDEPVFLLRAKDQTAPDVVRYWAMRAAAASAEPRMVKSALLHADEMEQWQRKHGSHVPDMPEDA
jgi:hypothetical protein